MRKSPNLAVISVILFLCSTASAADFASDFTNTNDRVWIGPQYWANPLEDWRIEDGKLVCISKGSDRNVHILTHQLGKKPGTLKMSVQVGLMEKGAKGSVGFRIGIQDEIDDYRARLHYGDGLDCGIDSEGRLFIGKGRSGMTIAPAQLKKGIELRLTATTKEQGGPDLILEAVDPASGKSLDIQKIAVDAGQLYGNIALCNNPLGPSRGKGKNFKGSRFWFANWKISGTKVEEHPDQAFGPILWSMHTLSRGVLKMTAQMPPVGKKDSQTVHLQIKNGGEWKTISDAKIAPLSYTATFRVPKWDDKNDVPYRLAYTVKKKDGSTSEAYWTGTVRKDPVDKKSLVVAAFTGNADYCFPNLQIVNNLNRQNPDVLFFSGDQIYEYIGGYGLIRSPVDRACLNYLRKWHLIGMSFGDLMRDRPTVCIPDDHDVYQGNIWGNGGNPITLARHQAGGYVQHRDFVNCVHRTQTAHLPDPYDPTPIKQNISVYYGPMVYGRVGFAIIADRMFKSGPRKVAFWKGRPDHVKDPNIDLKKLDRPDLKLLGDRQLKFLKDWAADWKGVDMKCVLSQTNFCNVANYHGGNRTYLVADLDSGGWPQTARNRAVAVMRKGFAFHLCGDQHLATIVHYGIDEPGDACYSFCVPSVANFYPRRWIPDEEGRPVKNRPKPGLPNTGDYIDGLGHPIRVYAVGNPEEKYGKGRLQSLHDKASGYGIVRFNRSKQTITIECYRLLVDVSDKKTEGDQFPGWPKTISMLDNYGKKKSFYLPTFIVKGMTDPVVQVMRQENKKVLYTLRIKGTKFRPWVFERGNYIVRVGEPGTKQVRTFEGVNVPDRPTAVMYANFEKKN